MTKARVGIIGGAGYTGGELLRILLFHPQVEITYVYSTSQSGKPVGATHLDLAAATNLNFTNQLIPDIDVVFLCLPHGAAKKFIADHPFADTVKIIDLSQDHRLTDTTHNFTYGLPELGQANISSAKNITNPGCFATCITLACLPLAANNLLQTDVHISAITGSTGAGHQPQASTHFSWRENNISTYKVFNHQHLPEIQQSLHGLQSASPLPQLYFVPFRGNFTRGIIASVYLSVQEVLTTDDLTSLYQTYYQHHPFTHVIDQEIALKQVINTNNCFLQVQVINQTIHVVSIIDNLLKGASGQAVQNMNLLLKIDESTGLNLKPSAF